MTPPGRSRPTHDAADDGRDIGGAIGSDVVDTIAGMPLFLAGWIGTTPDGTEAAYLLLCSPDERAPVAMPLIAGVLGLDRRGAMTASPDGATYVTVEEDLQAVLVCPGAGRWSRPVDEEWAGLARARRQVVLTVAHRPLAADADILLEVEQMAAASQCTLGLVPVADPLDPS